MMQIWAYFKDGVYTGDSVTASSAPDAREGLELREVEALPPHPLPPDTDLCTWSRAEDGRLVGTLTLAGEKFEATNAVKNRLARLDLAIARPLGEITQAQVLGEAVPDAALSRLVAINEDKQLLRARLAAIEATATAEELHALLAVPIELQTDEP